MISPGAFRRQGPDFCLGAATDALRTFLDIDITDDEQRETLAADITDIYLYGVMPRT